jgi:hypothetical protein
MTRNAFDEKARGLRGLLRNQEEPDTTQ